MPIGTQQDACEILEMCFDPCSALHTSCNADACYGRLFQKLTQFDMERQLDCKACSYTRSETQRQSVVRVEVEDTLQESISAALQEADIPDWRCEECGKIGARQQTALGDLPPFLIVHVNKFAGLATGVTAEATVRLSGTDLDRFAAVHHMGETPNSGHYTATVATKTMAYDCDDRFVGSLADGLANAWQNTYLVFLQNPSASVLPPCDDGAQQGEEDGDGEQDGGADGDDDDGEQEGSPE